MKKILKIAVIVVAVIIFVGIVAKLATPSSTIPNSPSLGKMSSSASLPLSMAPSGQSISGMVGDMVNSNSKSSPYLEESSQAPEEQSGTNIEKKIIKNGNLSLRVDSVDKAAQKITEISRSNEGDVFSSNFYQHGDNSKSGSTTVKVPFRNFEKTFNEIKKVAIIVSNESTSGQDVTEQYADLRAQLKNKQAEEEAFTRIMGQAQKIEDILAVQKELSRARGQIEQLQGKIKYLDSQTDMATIVISLSEDTSVTIIDSWRPWQVVKESTRELVKSVQAWIDFLIRLIIKVIPVLILYGLVLLIFYKIGRWIYFKFVKKDTQQ